MTSTLPKSPYLDMNDFQHNYKYKFVLPIIYVLNIIGAFFGPIFFGEYYKAYIIMLAVVGIPKIIQMVISLLVALTNNIILIRKMKQKKSTANYVPVAFSGD